MNPRLYHEFAHLWRLLSPPEDYAPEAEMIRSLLEGELGPPPRGGRRRILELGAGGGHTLSHLARHFDAEAVDRSEAMIAQSRALNPDVGHHVGDMRTVRLGRTFDAVLAHDAIDYLTTREDLRAAFDTAAAHLDRGGVFLVGPTYVKDTFIDHQIEHDQHTDGRIELTCVSHVHAAPPGPDETCELVLLLLIRKIEGRLRIEEDRHTCGLFDRSTWLELLRGSGFDVDKSVTEAGGDQQSPFVPFVAQKC